MRVWGAIAAGLVMRGGAVLISIRDALGSTPREAGTRMVIFGDGTFTGTIGGGTLEWRAIAEAQRMLAQRVIGERGSPDAQSITISPDLVTHFHDRSYALGPELGQCCGGRVKLRFEMIDIDAIESIRRLAVHEAEGVFAVTAEIEGDVVMRRITAAPDTDLRDIEHYGDAPRVLLLFGAGHVGRALVLALSALPFHTIWVDGRPDAFPGAVPANVTLVRPTDPVAVLHNAAAGSFVLIMTHSHELDLALCDAALRSGKFPHVGVIGSATKRARFERRLVEAGVSHVSIDQFVCPIGAPGPKSKLPAAIAAATVVELLVKDEMCLKVGVKQEKDQTPSTTAAELPDVPVLARERSSGR